MNLRSLFLAFAIATPFAVSAHDEVELPSPYDWTGGAKMGFSVESGNTDCTDLKADGHLGRDVNTGNEWDATVDFIAHVRYKKKNGKVSDDEASIKGRWRQQFQERWNWVVWQRMEYDHPVDLNFGSLTVAGLGYWPIKGEKTTLYLEGGLGYNVEFYDRDQDEDDFFTAAFSAEFFHKFCKNLDLTNVFFYLVPPERTEEYTIDNRLALHYHFNKTWGLETSYLWEYDNTPAVGKDRLDTTYQLSVTYSF